MLQGRYGVTGWRRQIRLEAYTKWLDAAHDFDFLLFDILSTISMSNFENRQKDLAEAYTRLQTAATQVNIAGPKRVDTELSVILRATAGIIADSRNRDEFMPIVHNWRRDRSYDKWIAWMESAEKLPTLMRNILKTE